MKKLLLAAAILLAVTACAQTRAVPPEVNLLDLQVADMTLSHANLLATLRVYNPNPVPLTIRDIDYTLRLNGVRVASGQSVKEVRVESEGSAEVGLRLSTSYLDLIRLTTGLNPEKPLNYKLDGSIRVGGFRILDRTFRFDREGKLSLEGLERR